jgi:hypothetical protein
VIRSRKSLKQKTIEDNNKSQKDTAVIRGKSERGIEVEIDVSGDNIAF